MHEDIIKNCPHPLLLGADETMLCSLIKEKVITRIGSTTLASEIDLPHITCMCAHTGNGIALPLFIILPNKIQTLPQELEEFSENGQAWFASSKSGWMTRDLFLVWTIHIIHWLSMYRSNLDKSIRNKSTLLVMDGHGSRECPLALHLLKCNGIDVLILPAHTTHITQMFDVCLAHPLKQLSAKIMKKLIQENEGQKTQSKISIIRKSAVKAIISAWSSVCNVQSCEMAAKVTGFYPFDPTQVQKSKFVIIKSPQEDYEYMRKRQERTRLDINGKIINTDEFIQKIIDRLSEHPRFEHLYQIPKNSMIWNLIIQKFCQKKLPNDCFFLGKLPSYISAAGNIVYLD